MSQISIQSYKPSLFNGIYGAYTCSLPIVEKYDLITISVDNKYRVVDFNHIFNTKKVISSTNPSRYLRTTPASFHDNKTTQNEYDSINAIQNAMELDEKEQEKQEIATTPINSYKYLKIQNKSTNKIFAAIERNRIDKYNVNLIEREIKILQKLNKFHHPNIIQFKQCYIDENNFYLLTNYYSQTNLQQKLQQNGVLKENEVSHIIKCILDAINYSHKKNIIHNALHLVNIIYKDENEKDVVIMDWSEAIDIDIDDEKVYNNDTNSLEEISGNILYAPPEIIRSRNFQELKKGDMWAIGVITFCLLSGKTPWNGPNRKKIMTEILRATIRFPDDVEMSDECKDFIYDLLSKHVERRIDTENALKHKWIQQHDVISEDSELL